MKSGIELIADERQRQIDDEGWTPEHDNKYSECELPRAAICYANNASHRNWPKHPKSWPWDMSWWKPSPNDKTRDLVKAGALIAAEIDRRQRAGQ